MSRLSFLIVILPYCLAAQNPYAGNAKEADAGRGLFRIRCSPCHGIKAQGGRGPDLTLGTFNNGNDDKDLFRVIANGVPGTEMPGFVANSGDENIWRLITYIRSTTAKQETPQGGDKAKGESIFWGKGGCGNCHMVGTRGGPMGPDLTRVGRKRSLAYLKQSIMEPNADLTPGFYKITMVTKSGQTIVGTQRGFDNFSAQVMTTDGKIHSYSREDLTKCDRDYTSMMPPYKFSDDEMKHLLTYLTSLRGEN